MDWFQQALQVTFGQLPGFVVGASVASFLCAALHLREASNQEKENERWKEWETRRIRSELEQKIRREFEEGRREK